MTRTILLADDSVTIQKVVELTFMDQDYRIEAVSDGSTAMAKLTERKPDLLIADVHMPGADGYQVCRRSKEVYPDVPVLLLVGTFEHFDDQAAAAAGAESHLKKPFDSQDLLHQVEALISRAGRPVADVAAGEAEDLDEPEPAPPAADFELPALSDDEVTSVSEAAFELEPEPEDVQEAGGTPFPLSAGGPEPAVSAVGRRFDAWGVEVSEVEPHEEDAAILEPSSWETESMKAFGAEEAPPWSELEPPAPAETEDLAAIGGAAEPAVAESPSAEPPEAEEAAEELAAPAAPSVEAPSEEPSAELAAGNGLSDEDVDRIARRIIDLVGDKALREVAWEVVPDLAEVIIKERIRELESQVG